MSKRQSHQKFRSSAARPDKLALLTDPVAFQSHLQALLNQQQYRQALDAINRHRSQHPDLVLTPTEAEIWLLRGQQEFKAGTYKAAETSFRQALAQGLLQTTHYWIARSLLKLNRLDAALALVQSAFEQKQMPKDQAICYLKLLLLKGETATVETLISQQTKRFSAAHLHWARGVLALQLGQPELALPAFQKIKRPQTAGDFPEAWVIYTHQKLGNWLSASTLLGLKTTSVWGFSQVEPKYLKHPILQRLAMLQQSQTQELPLNTIRVPSNDRGLAAAASAIALVQLIEQEKYHEAAHVLVNQDRRSPTFPEITALRTPLLIQAGQQSLQEGEPDCTVTFWQTVLTEQPFNPQLAVNLRSALSSTQAYQEEQRLLTRLIKWVEQDAKQNSSHWPGDRAPRTLAHLHCDLADVWMALGRGRTALGAVQQAERICPTSPEVIGRKGLIALMDDDYDTAMPLLTQALDQGCRSSQVYAGLLGCWDEQNNPQAKLAARQRFGQKFGDLNPIAEIEFAPWLEALYAHDYKYFSQLVKSAAPPDAPLQALQIFVKAVQGGPSPTGKVSLNQAQAQQQWDAHLKPLVGEPQIFTLEAIVLSTQRFAKREKGIAALVSKYQQQLFNLSAESPAASVAYLITLAVKDADRQKLEVPLRRYLESMPQPGNALAQLQLQVRKLGWFRGLTPFLTEALQREPQNPLLLLAQATLSSSSSPDYDRLRQQGFEIARRVQDSKALQAFREEEAFLDLLQNQARRPSPGRLESLDADDMDGFLEAMIRKMFGQKVPRAELERMMPLLKRQMMEELPDLDDDDDDDDFLIDLDRPQKRKRSFRDL